MPHFGMKFEGCPATASSTSAGTAQNGTKPQRMVNWCRGRSTQASPQWTLRGQGGTISAVTDASAAGRVSSRDDSDDASSNGATGLDSVALPSESDQTAPEASLSAAANHQRRGKKFRCKRSESDSFYRNAEVVCPEKSALLPPPGEEDWEAEIREGTLTHWEKMRLGARPYGPEDALHFALRDLTPQQTDADASQGAANYSPAACHPRPVRWSCLDVPTEPDQFADADE